MVLFFGIIRRDKGLFKLTTALQRLARQGGPEVRLMIAGAPKVVTEEEILADLTGKGLLSKTSLFLRYLDEEEIPLFFKASDLLALPYDRGFSSMSGPLTIAATNGVPAVGFDVGQMGHDIKAHHLGAVSEPDDIDGLTELLRRVVTGALSFDVDQLKAYARSRTWEEMARHILQMYHVLIHDR